MRDYFSSRNQFRNKRFQVFLRTLNPGSDTKILDAGGTSSLWEGTGLEHNVTLLNIIKPKNKDLKKGFKAVQGDALDMYMFENKQFDIVFSNSVIEHVGTWEKQNLFAENIKRVGNRYWVQTPNRYFPIEPHFRFPLFEFFPVTLKKIIANHWKYSNYKKYGIAKEEILNELSNIRLLNKNELLQLFTGSNLYEEKVFGLTKSLTVYSS